MNTILNDREEFDFFLSTEKGADTSSKTNTHVSSLNN